jgi:hypothetical protein
MLAVADSAQRSFFDAAWCGNVVPRDSFYGLLVRPFEDTQKRSTASRS